MARAPPTPSCGPCSWWSSRGEPGRDPRRGTCSSPPTGSSAERLSYYFSHPDAVRQPGGERGEIDEYALRLYDFAEADTIVERVGEVADARGVSRAQVALGWLLGREGVTAPIVGATKAGQLEEAVAATGLELTDDEVERLEAPYPPRAVRGHE